MSFLGYWLSFEGRLRRSDFWGRVVAVILLVACGMMFIWFVASDTTSGTIRALALVAVALFGVVMALANLAAHVRRWHDRDKSGWWILIGLIPIVGPIWSVVECGFLDGTPGPNRFGPSPKSVELAGGVGTLA